MVSVSERTIGMGDPKKLKLIFDPNKVLSIDTIKRSYKSIFLIAQASYFQNCPEQKILVWRYF